MVETVLEFDIETIFHIYISSHLLIEFRFFLITYSVFVKLFWSKSRYIRTKLWQNWQNRSLSKIKKCSNVLTLGNIEQQSWESRFVKVTRLQERKKKRFEYISLWQAIRSLLSRQYSLGFSQGQNGWYFGLFLAGMGEFLGLYDFIAFTQELG